VPETVNFNPDDGYQREVFFNGSAFWDTARVPNALHPNDSALMSGDKLEGKVTGFVDCRTPGPSANPDWWQTAHDNSVRFTFDLLTRDANQDRPQNDQWPVNWSISDDQWPADHTEQTRQVNYALTPDKSAFRFTGCVGIYAYAYWNGVGPSNEGNRATPKFLGLLPINQAHRLKIKVTQAHSSLKPLTYTVNQNGSYPQVSQNFSTQYEFYINDRFVGRLPRGNGIKPPQKCTKTGMRPYFGGDDAWTHGVPLATPEVHPPFTRRSFDIYVRKPGLISPGN